MCKYSVGKNKNILQKGCCKDGGLHKAFGTSFPGNRVCRAGLEMQWSEVTVLLKGALDVVPKRLRFVGRDDISNITRQAVKTTYVWASSVSHNDSKASNKQK